MDRKKFIKNMSALTALSSLSDLHSAINKWENTDVHSMDYLNDTSLVYSSSSKKALGNLLLIHFNQSIPDTEVERVLIQPLKNGLKGYNFNSQFDTHESYISQLLESEWSLRKKMKRTEWTVIRPHLKEAFNLNKSNPSSFQQEFINWMGMTPNVQQLVNPYLSKSSIQSRLDAQVLEHFKLKSNRSSHNFFMEWSDFDLYKTNRELFNKCLKINVNELINLINTSNDISNLNRSNSSDQGDKKHQKRLPHNQFTRIVLFSDANEFKKVNDQMASASTSSNSAKNVSMNSNSSIESKRNPAKNTTYNTKATAGFVIDLTLIN